MDINNNNKSNFAIQSTSSIIGKNINLFNQLSIEILTIIQKYEDNFIKIRNKLIGVGCPTASLIASFNINQSEQIRLQNIETEESELIDLIVEKTNEFRETIIKGNKDVIEILKEFREKAKKKNQNAMQHEEDNTIDPSTMQSSSINDTVAQTQDYCIVLSPRLFSKSNQTQASMNNSQASINNSSQFIPNVNSTIVNQEYFRPSAFAVNENIFNSTVNNENEKLNETVVFKRPAAKPAAKPSKNLKNIINKQVEYFKCDIDGKTFTSKIKLCNHMDNHLKTDLKHSDSKVNKKKGFENNFQCKICSKKFKSVANLHVHEKTHNKKFQCEICKSMQPSQGRLNRHIKFKHENTETYKCEKCGKELLKRHLIIHQKTHDKNRPKPFKCQRCDFATDIQHSYNRHEKFHESQDKKFAAMKNPLKCEKCSTFHRNKKSLSDHMRFVHTEVQFQCDLCAKFIKIKKNFISHMNAHILNKSKNK